ncbi:hypothetical protein IJT93_00660 [bacterium]|nr:hypothetical protein [bacterium]
MKKEDFNIDKEKTYSVSLSKFYMLSLFGVIASCLFCWQGIRLMSGRGDDMDPLVILMASVPILAGIGIIIIIVMIYITYQGRKVTISNKAVTYQRNNKEPVVLNWRNVRFVTRKTTDKSMLDRTSVTDGEFTFQIERFFFPDYDKMTIALRKIKEKRKKDSDTISIRATSSNDDLKALGIIRTNYQ